MKKRFGVVFLVLLFIFSFSGGGWAAEKTAEQIKEEIMVRVNTVSDPNAAKMQFGAAIVADPVTKNVIYEYNADQRMYPASTTKLMSFVLVYEGINAGTYHFEDVVTISPTVEAVDEGDLGYLAGETRTLGELLNAMAVISANDASVAVAEYIAGSEAAYVELMNAKAKELGMNATHFVNCTGLHDDNHYTTARDLWKLSEYAYPLDGLLTLTSTQNLTFTVAAGTKTVFNTNKLLFWYPGADGMKTGFTTPAGRCLVATAVRDGLRLNSVVLGGTDNYSHYTESMILLNYGFSKYAMAEAVTTGKKAATIFLPKGKVEEVDVTAKESITLPTAKEGETGYQIDYKLSESVTAPVTKGDVLGKIEITANGEILATTNMIAMESVEKQNFFQSIFRFFRDLFDKD